MPTFSNNEILSSVRDKINNSILLAEQNSVNITTLQGDVATIVSTAGQFVDGAAATPSVTFSSDTDTGLYRPVANNVGISVGGNEIARINTLGLKVGNPAGVVTGAIGLISVEAAGAANITAKRNSADANPPTLFLAKSRGTVVSDYTIVAVNDQLAQIVASGADGTTQNTAASIRSHVEGTPAAGDVRSNWRFFTGSATGTTEALKIDTNQAVLANGLGGLGYGTGAGGAVTQITSRATAVTLNKPSGQITMFSAAGSATWNSFTFNNSVVTANDTIVLTQTGGTNNYVFAAKVAAGVVTISFQTTGGVATDAPIINFSVIRAVNT